MSLSNHHDINIWHTNLNVIFVNRIIELRTSRLTLRTNNPPPLNHLIPTKKHTEKLKWAPVYKVLLIELIRLIKQRATFY